MQLITRVLRGDRIESVHTGEAVVCDSEGEIIFSTGRPEYSTYMRSSIKPFQAYPLINSGAAGAFHLDPKEIALCCASHNGETIHVGIVGDLQERTGLKEEMLRCGVHPPLDSDAAESLFRSNLDLTQNHNNCSGKHTGMLLSAKHQGFPLDDYIRPDHPIQRQIHDYLCELLRRKEIDLGIDGCSVPTYYMTIKELAILFRNLADQQDKVLSVLYKAMTTEPYMVAGRNRFDTDLMQAMGGTMVSKLGAEGIRGLGARIDDEAFGIGLKVIDGARRPGASMMLAILRHMGWWEPGEDELLDRYFRPVLRNHRSIEVGRIETEVVE